MTGKGFIMFKAFQYIIFIAIIGAIALVALTATAAEPLPAHFIAATPPYRHAQNTQMPEGMTYATPPATSGESDEMTPDIDARLATMESEETQISLPRYISEADWKRTHDWWYLLKHRQLNLADTTVIYPKFMGFCVKVYNWADKFFNSYDSDYVIGTGKRWKARIMSDNWSDGYTLTLKNQFTMRMLSNIYCNAGAYIQYMAVSVGYTVDLSNIMGNKAPTHKKLGFGFSCARFEANVHYDENTGGTIIRNFSKFEDDKLIREKFTGLKMHTLGFEAYYFLNHRRYSQGAAYNYSKIQLRSQGSGIVGFAYNNIDVNVDLNQLPANMLIYLTPGDILNYRFHYNSFFLMGGYGYNFVANKHFLFNITALPKVGIARMYEDSTQSHPTQFACGIYAKASMTVNLNNYFICVAGLTNGTLLINDTNLFYSSIYNVNISLGIRF